MTQDHQQALIDECLNAQAVLEELITHEESQHRTLKNLEVYGNLNLRRFECKRCEHVTHTQFAFPYCSNCNWDFLTDPTINPVAQAA
jgi:hypothetical protein